MCDQVAQITLEGNPQLVSSEELMDIARAIHARKSIERPVVVQVAFEENKDEFERDVKGAVSTLIDRYKKATRASEGGLSALFTVSSANSKKIIYDLQVLFQSGDIDNPNPDLQTGCFASDFFPGTNRKTQYQQLQACLTRVKRGTLKSILMQEGLLEIPGQHLPKNRSPSAYKTHPAGMPIFLKLQMLVEAEKTAGHNMRLGT